MNDAKTQKMGSSKQVTFNHVSLLFCCCRCYVPATKKWFPFWNSYWLFFRAPNQYFSGRFKRLMGNSFVLLSTMAKCEIVQPNGIMHWLLLRVLPRSFMHSSPSRTLHIPSTLRRAAYKTECFPVFHTKAEAPFHMMRNPLSKHIHTLYINW